MDMRTIFAIGLEGESNTSGAFTESQEIPEKRTFSCDSKIMYRSQLPRPVAILAQVPPRLPNDLFLGERLLF